MIPTLYFFTVIPPCFNFFLKKRLPDLLFYYMIDTVCVKRSAAAAAKVLITPNTSFYNIPFYRLIVNYFEDYLFGN